VTEGSQQGLDLACKVFLDPGDEVLVETPAYVGALQALRLASARVTFLPCDDEGVDPEALRRALRRRPRLLYLTPTFQNPAGSAIRRAGVARLPGPSTRATPCSSKTTPTASFGMRPLHRLPWPSVSIPSGDSTWVHLPRPQPRPPDRVGRRPPSLVKHIALAKQPTDYARGRCLNIWSFASWDTRPSARTWLVYAKRTGTGETPWRLRSQPSSAARCSGATRLAASFSGRSSLEDGTRAHYFPRLFASA